MSADRRWADWRRQADNDQAFAENALKSGFYSQCCFICQQVAEKALKAYAFSRGAESIRSHSLVKLCEALSINGELQRAAQVLDRYYLTGRYPDALPGGAPLDAFSQEDAAQAVGYSRLFLDRLSVHE